MRRELNAILTLAAKDGRLFLADKRAALLCFAVPVVLASVFGLIFEKPKDKRETTRLPMMLVVEDDGPFTQSLVEELKTSDRIEATIVDRAAATERLSERRPGIAVILPKGFESLAAWNPQSNRVRPTIQLLHDPLCRDECQWAEGVVCELLMRKLAREKLSAFVPEAGLALPFAVETVESADARAGFNSYSHSFSGMTLQYLLFWGMESGLLLLRDRNRSVWLRLRAAPVPLWCVLIAKALSTATIAFLQVLATFAFGYLFFGVSIAGSWVGFLLLAAGVSGLAASTGLLVAAVGGTEARARSLCILLILGVSLLGGLWLPSFVLPAWARECSLALPTTWAMRGFEAVTWQGRGFADSLASAGVVGAFSAVFLTLAMVRLISTEARRQRGIV